MIKHICAFFLLIQITSAQKFSFPIDTIDITGNFGEIRNRHFHQGIDFSTKGKEYYPVKSVDDGYVYRIKISKNGFGKCLYIHHPSGLLSVYAHLNAFSNKIQSLVNQYLIQNRINELDIILKKDSIQVQKNEIVGLSGNTGSSTGPHLHFEIRNELTEIPENPFFYFNINDTTKPAIQKIIFYNLIDTIHPKPLISNKPKYPDTIIVPSITGIAFAGYDKIYPNGNPNNIYKVQVFLDNQKIYQHRLKYISFDNTIYVEYFSEKINKQIFQKCFAPHLYPLYFYDTLVNKGRIILKDTNVHTLHLSFCDERNNCTDTTILIKTKQVKTFKNISIKQLMLCLQPIYIKNKYFEIQIPEKSIFNDIDAQLFYNAEKKSIQFTHSPLPLKFPATLKISHQLNQNEIHKTLLISAYRYYLPESYDKNFLTFNVKELSNYYLYTDKLSPKIKPLSFNKKKKAIIISPQQRNIYFHLSDNTSIKKYSVYINQQFCVSYYYESKKLLSVEIPQENISSDEYNIQIIATDIVDNTTQKSYKLIFK
ncbi:MAG: M23 family metallopeptidase [Bacteroidota bacterium]